MVVKKKKGVFVKNLIVLLVTLILCFLILEVITRILFPNFSPSRDNEFQFYEYDSVLGWKNNPGAEGLFKTPDTLSYVTINSKGLRDKEYDYEKDSSVKRILFFGDSHVWGYGLNNSDRFSEILEKKLGEDYEVINMGVTGYSTDQEFLLLRDEGLKYNPNVVVLVFYANDLGGGLHNLRSGYYKSTIAKDGEGYVVENMPVPEPEDFVEARENYQDQGIFAVVKFFTNKSRFLYFISKYSYDGFKNFLIRTGSSQEAPQYDVESDEWQNTLFIIGLIDDLCEENDVKFILTYLPSKQRIKTNSTNNMGEILGNFSLEQGITYLDLTEELLKQNKEADIFRKFDAHMNEKGNEILAEYFYEKLINEELIE
ncbi:MAG: GDSL-type esterase/lipase family protein [archaeon]